MEQPHSLSIITEGIGERSISVEADIPTLSPPPYLEFPESVEGKLLVTPEQIQDFRFGGPGFHARKIMLGGQGYRFTKLEKDGTFEARKDNW